MDYKEIIKTMVILIDTREKSSHITDVFDELGITYRRQKLDAGDYSFEITVDNEVISFDKTVVIERKNSIDELAMCYSSDRERFKREFDRMEDADTDCILIIEDASLSKIRNHDYKSRVVPKSLEATLWAWKWKYGYDIFFLEKECTAEYIYNVFYYYVRALYKDVKNETGQKNI